MASVSLLKKPACFSFPCSQGAHFSIVLSSAVPLRTATLFHCLEGRRQLNSSRAEDAEAAGLQHWLLGYSPSPALTACGSADTVLAQWPELSHQDWQNKPGEVFTAEQDVKWRSCAPVVMPPRARGGEATSAFSWVRAAGKAQLLSLLHSQPVAEVQNVLV